MNKTEKGGAAEATARLINVLAYNPFIGIENGEMVNADGVVSFAPLKHNDDWAKEALHNGMRQEYNISLGGVTLRVLTLSLLDT